MRDARKGRYGHDWLAILDCVVVRLCDCYSFIAFCILIVETLSKQFFWPLLQLMINRLMNSFW